MSDNVSNESREWYCQCGAINNQLAKKCPACSRPGMVREGVIICSAPDANQPETVAVNQEPPDVEIRKFMDGKGRVLVAHIPLDERPPQFFAVVFVSAGPGPGAEPIEFTENLPVKIECPGWTGGANDRSVYICSLAQKALRKYDEVLNENKAAINHKALLKYADREKARMGFNSQPHIQPLCDAAGNPLLKRK